MHDSLQQLSERPNEAGDGLPASGEVNKVGTESFSAKLLSTSALVKIYFQATKTSRSARSDMLVENLSSLKR